MNFNCVLASQKEAALSSSVRTLLSCGVLLVALFACGCGGSDSPDAPGASAPQPTPTAPAPTTRVLSIAPVAQQTTQWCWAATAEMVFRHFGLPNVNGFGNYQCGVVAAFYGAILPLYPACATDCSYCAQMAIATMDREQLLIEQYGLIARQFGLQSRVLRSSLRFSQLSTEEVATEIDAGRPILAGISPNGYAFPDVSEHAVLVVGYDYTGVLPAVIVNDPFPYELFPLQPNPYFRVGGVVMQPGRYKVSYQSFVGTLNWANTIYEIQ